MPSQYLQTSLFVARWERLWKAVALGLSFLGIPACVVPRIAADPAEIWESEAEATLPDNTWRNSAHLLEAASFGKGVLIRFQFQPERFQPHPNYEFVIGLRDGNGMSLVAKNFPQNADEVRGVLPGGLPFYVDALESPRVRQSMARRLVSRSVFGFPLSQVAYEEPMLATQVGRTHLYTFDSGENARWGHPAADNSGFSGPYEFHHRKLEAQWSDGKLVAVEMQLPVSFDAKMEACEIKHWLGSNSWVNRSYEFDPFVNIRAIGRFSERSLGDWNILLQRYFEKDWFLWGYSFQVKETSWTIGRDDDMAYKQKVILDVFPELEIKITVRWEKGQFVGIRYEWLPLFGAWRPRGY